MMEVQDSRQLRIEAANKYVELRQKPENKLTWEEKLFIQNYLTHLQGQTSGKGTL